METGIGNVGRCECGFGKLIENKSRARGNVLAVDAITPRKVEPAEFDRGETVIKDIGMGANDMRNEPKERHEIHAARESYRKSSRDYVSLK
jgi:hypothetical protein